MTQFNPADENKSKTVTCNMLSQRHANTLSGNLFRVAWQQTQSKTQEHQETTGNPSKTNGSSTSPHRRFTHTRNTLDVVEHLGIFKKKILIHVILTPNWHVQHDVQQSPSISC